MARKKENELTYLQMPIPSGQRYYKQTKVSWGGLNRRQELDTGMLSMEQNISTSEAPYLVPSQKHVRCYNNYGFPIGLFGFDDFLISIYRTSSSIRLDYIKADGTTYTGKIQLSGATADDDYQRCIVEFNVYDSPTDPVSGKYIKKLLIFPDKVSMPMEIDEAESDPSKWGDDELASASMAVLYHFGDYYYDVKTKSNGKRYAERNGGSGYFVLDSMDVLVREYYNDEPEEDESGAIIYPPSETASECYYYRNTYNQDVYRYCQYETEDGSTAYGWRVSIPPSVPNIKYASVHMSRLFGVDDTRVYASGYNDYTNWNLDTATEYNESNAWVSPAQSNTKAGGDFTGITTFQSHVICFKRDFMHEIYNTKNPFRIQDIFADGTIDNRTIQDVDGRLIFVSKDGVKIYTGSNPRNIGYNLNIGEYTKAVSGTDCRNYYLYCEDSEENKHLFVYDSYTECWSERSIGNAVVSFAHNKNGMYMLCANGEIYRLDTGKYSQKWCFETDLITRQSYSTSSSYPSVNIKHLKKIQMLADIADNARIRVYMLYDDEEFNENTSHLVYSSTKHGRVPIRVKTRQTAHYGIKLHVEGYGYVKLYELELFFEHGGDIYV